MQKGNSSVFTSLFHSLREDSLFLFEHMGIEEGEGAIKYIVSKYLKVIGVYRFFATLEEETKTVFESDSVKDIDLNSKVNTIIESLKEKININIEREKTVSNKSVKPKEDMDSTSILSSLLSNEIKEVDFGYGLIDEKDAVYYYYLRTSEKGYIMFTGEGKYDYSFDVLWYLSQQYHIFKLQQDKLDVSRSMLYIDEVTGTYNTRYLDMVLDSEIKRSLRFKEEFSLLFLDLDEFKKVNDFYGHLTGSSVLVQVASLFKYTLRQIDTIVRYGGDEFVVVLLNTNENQAFITAERLRSKVDEAIFYTYDNKHKLHLTVSIGIASFPKVDTKEKLLKIADEAMYMSKKRGKNQVRIWNRDVVEFSSNIESEHIKSIDN